MKPYLNSISCRFQHLGRFRAEHDLPNTSEHGAEPAQTVQQHTRPEKMRGLILSFVDLRATFQAETAFK